MSKNVVKKLTKKEMMDVLAKERTKIHEDKTAKRMWNILRAVTYKEGIEKITDEDVAAIPYQSTPLGTYTEILFDMLCCIEGVEDVEVTDDIANALLRAEIETKMWLEEALKKPEHPLDGKELAFFLLSMTETNDICQEVYGRDARDPEIARNYKNIAKRAKDLNDELCFLVY